METIGRIHLRSYAGVGSRDTPAEVLALMTRIAEVLGTRGYVLRSGGARGADSAFEAGAPKDRVEIFLPWQGFEGHDSPLHEVPPEALAIATRYHPAGKRLSRDTLLKMGRNVQQVLGRNLSNPAQFLVCWTPDGADGVRVPTTRITRGTGQAIRVAAAHNVPVFNLADRLTLQRVCRGLGITPPHTP